MRADLVKAVLRKISDKNEIYTDKRPKVVKSFWFVQ